mmetsp:Transcript_18768/g.27751  ORF Transcript_18768/g.27751 Transcript_18768/m.27751 type:complete len:81 (-) Transcript_18768:904-1146(-)
MQGLIMSSMRTHGWTEIFYSRNSALRTFVKFQTMKPVREQSVECHAELQLFVANDISSLTHCKDIVKQKMRKRQLHISNL